MTGATRSRAGRARRGNQPPPAARGLGWAHRQQVARLVRTLVDGTPCWWCGRPMFRAQRLAGDHSIPRARGGTAADRLLHLECNAARGDGSRDHLRPAIAPRRAIATRATTPSSPRSRAW